ncbi:TatD DNase family protein [Flavobacterium aquidurense]|nr:TatD DNase family protein [Flavobacterium aquidurense]
MRRFPNSLLKKYNERRCESSFLPHVAETIAQFKGITLDKVSEETSRNSKSFFGF